MANNARRACAWGCRQPGTGPVHFLLRQGPKDQYMILGKLPLGWISVERREMKSERKINRVKPWQTDSSLHNYPLHSQHAMNCCF